MDNITATMSLSLKKSIFEVYDMRADDVIYTYATILIDSFNQSNQINQAK